jgi:hypothetical protein
VDVEAPFDAVEVLYGTFHVPGPALAIRVRDPASGRTLAAGSQAAGYADNRLTATAVSPRVRAGRPVDVCIRNVGPRRVGIWGEPARWTMLFLRPPRSTLSQLPTIFHRASIFRPSWVGAWTFWLLLACVLAGLPGLLWVALRRTEEPR